MPLLPQDCQQLLDQCHVELTGASEGGIKAKMYEVVFEFFNDSSIWHEIIPFTVVPGQHDYHIEATEGQIVRLSACWDGIKDFVPALMRDNALDVIHIVHPPVSTQQFLARVVKNICLPVDKHGFPLCPEWLLKKWHLAIKHGIVGQLANEQNKSYSDSKKALYNLSKFRQYVGNARSLALRANTEGASSWRFPQSYRANSQQGGVPSFGGGFGDRTF